MVGVSALLTAGGSRPTTAVVSIAPEAISYCPVSKKRPGSAELFPTDEPIAADAMIGRADDVDAMAQALLGGANLVVAGPRRTGKTSVCDAAMAICAREHCYTASVDLF